MSRQGDLKQFGNMIEEATHKAQMRTWVKILWTVFFGYSVVVAISLWSEWDKDSTDGQERSGLKLHIDNLTGCEYLSAPRGGLHPRLTIDGIHSGCANNE